MQKIPAFGWPAVYIWNIYHSYCTWYCHRDKQIGEPTSLSPPGIIWAPSQYKDGLSRYGDFHVNSLAPGRFKFNFRYAIFKLTLVNGGWGISYQIALRWMPLDLTDDKSTLVQVMAWCCQATSHYLSQCWPDLCRHMASLGPHELTIRRLWDCLIFNMGIPFLARRNLYIETAPCSFY